MSELEKHLSAAAVARLLGVKTATLRKWRLEGRGPAGYFHVGPTLVVYPESEILKFLRECKRVQE
jgi:transposase-like protein